MIGISANIDGDKALIGGLGALKDRLPGAIGDGMGDIIERIHAAAIKRLQGPRRGLRTVSAKKSGRQRAVAQRPDLAGGDPVPRVTGNLLRLLGSVKPGQSKSSNGLTFTAGPLEAILYNSAEYASVISDGTGTSARYGPRPFGRHALKEVEHEIPAILAARINALVSGIGL